VLPAEQELQQCSLSLKATNARLFLEAAESHCQVTVKSRKTSELSRPTQRGLQTFSNLREYLHLILRSLCAGCRAQAVADHVLLAQAA